MGSRSQRRSASCVGALLLWEIGARAGWIDAFFWSQPSAIADTMAIFFTTGDAWTDISFTFRSTIFGFSWGLRRDRCWASRSGGHAITPPSCSLTSSAWNRSRSLRSRRSSSWCSASDWSPKSRSRPRSPVVVSTLTAYAGVKALDPDGEKLFYSLGATRIAGVPQAGGAVLPALDHLGAAGEYRACLDRAPSSGSSSHPSMASGGRSSMPARPTTSRSSGSRCLCSPPWPWSCMATVSWLESMLRKGVQQ